MKSKILDDKKLSDMKDICVDLIQFYFGKLDIINEPENIEDFFYKERHTTIPLIYDE